MGQQLWAVSSLGGYLANDALSKKARVVAQSTQVFRRFVSPMEAGGAGSGEYVQFRKIKNISTAGTTALSETSTIPKHNFVIVPDSAQIKEYGNSISFTLKAKTLAEISLPPLVEEALRNDMGSSLDIIVSSEFTGAEYKAVCVATNSVAITTNGTATSTATANLSDQNVRDIVDNMKKRNVPKLKDGRFVAICSVNSIRGVFDKIQDLVKYTDYKPLMGNDVGAYYGVRFIEETNVLSNVLGDGSQYGEAVFFGADAVKEVIAIPESLRIKVPDDYGRDLGAAWYALLGFKRIWTYSQDAESHIVHVTSA